MIEQKLNEIKSAYDNACKKHDEKHLQVIESVKSGIEITETVKKDLEQFKSDMVQKETELKTLINEVATQKNGLNAESESETLGEKTAKIIAEKNYNCGVVSIGEFERKANLTHDSSPIAKPMTLNKVVLNDTPITLRDYINSVPTSSNAVEWVKRTVRTNNAKAIINDHEQYPQSEVVYANQTVGIATLGHYMPVSKQMLGDVPMITSLVQNELVQGLKEAEEEQILLGDGTNGRLSGLITNARTITPTSTTKTDNLHEAIYKVVDESGLMPDGIVLNYQDWAEIERSKDNNGMYISVNPYNLMQKQLWGMPVFLTNNMTSGDFLVGNFKRGATLFDRQKINLRISDAVNDFTIKNLIALIGESRVGLGIFDNTAFTFGTFKQ